MLTISTGVSVIVINGCADSPLNREEVGVGGCEIGPSKRGERVSSGGSSCVDGPSEAEPKYGLSLSFGGDVLFGACVDGSSETDGAVAVGGAVLGPSEAEGPEGVAREDFVVPAGDCVDRRAVGGVDRPAYAWKYERTVRCEDGPACACKDGPACAVGRVDRPAYAW